MSAVIAIVGLALGASLLRFVPAADRWVAAFTFVVATNASAVAAARFDTPSPLLLVSAGVVAWGATRFAMSDPRPSPSGALPLAAGATIVGIFLAASIGPFVSSSPGSSTTAVGTLTEHFVVLGAAAYLTRRRAGWTAAVCGIAAGGVALSVITNLQAITATKASDALGFGVWNAEVIGGVGDSLRAAGPFADDPNAYALYLAVGLGAVVGLALRLGRPVGAPIRLWWLGAASILVAIAQTASRGGLLAAAAVLIAVPFLGVVDRRWLAGAAAVLLLVLVLPLGLGARLATLGDLGSVATSSSSADRGLRGRASEMLAAVDMFEDHPLVGVGYGTYNDRYLDYSRGIGIDPRYEDRSAHSLPLEIAAEQGLIGLAAWVAFAAIAVVTIRRARRRGPTEGTAFALAWSAFGIASLFLHDVHPRLLWTLVGLTLGATWWLTPRPSAPVPRPARGDDRPLRVAMVIQSYVPAVGGAERQLAALAPMLVERGADVVVVTRAFAGRPVEDEVDGIRVVRIPVGGPKPVASARFVRGARRVLREFDPDVVHAYDSLTPSMIALGHRSVSGAPVVTKLLRSGPLGDLERLERKPFGRSRSRRLIGEVDTFVAISSDLERELELRGVGDDRRATIPNGVDTDRFRPATRRRRNDVPIVIAHGRLAPEKRLGELAGRWHEVTEHHPGAVLRLVGVGPDETAVTGITGVEWLGQRDDVDELLRQADVYVSASRAEGLSNSLLEAMATALPCVVTDVGGVRDLVREGEGVVVAADDLDELVERLVDLLGDADEQRRLGDAARRRVVDAYGLDRTADDLIALYRRLAGRSIDDPVVAVTS